MNQLDIYQYDLDNNGVINYYDLQLKQKDTGATEAELADLPALLNQHGITSPLHLSITITIQMMER